MPTRMHSSEPESCSDLMPETIFTRPWKRLLQPALPSTQDQSCTMPRAPGGTRDAQPLPSALTGF